MKTRFLLIAALLLIPVSSQARTIECTHQGCSDQVITAPHRTIHAGRYHASHRARITHWRSIGGQLAVNGVGPGIVRSHKTGATARVAASFAAVAQAVVDDLEQNYGASIKFMGGYRRGPCASWSLHPCGLAIDLCQLSRGVVDRRCNMPSRAVEEKVARAHGGYSGGEWCNNDRGHIQAKETAGRCGHNLYAAVGEFHKRHHRRLRYARQ